MALKREDVLALRNGEVVQYPGKDNNGYDLYLLVDKIDSERGVVTGHLLSAYGVNNLSIDYLIKNGLDIAKWGNPQSHLEEKSQEDKLSELIKRKENYEIGLTHKHELALVNEPPDPLLLQSIQDKINKLNLSAQNPKKFLSDEDWGPQGKHPFKHGGDLPHPNKKY